jgi:hypothetical protein
MTLSCSLPADAHCFVELEMGPRSRIVVEKPGQYSLLFRCLAVRITKWFRHFRRSQTEAKYCDWTRTRELLHVMRQRVLLASWRPSCFLAFKQTLGSLVSPKRQFQPIFAPGLIRFLIRS